MSINPTKRRLSKGSSSLLPVVAAVIASVSAAPALADDICKTPAGPAPVPIPYPNIGTSSKVTVQDIPVTKKLDKSSAKLFMQTSSGNTPPAAGYQNYLLTHTATQLGVDDAFGTVAPMPTSGAVVLRWKTSIAGAAGGKWSITTSPTSPVLASGTVAASGNGAVVQFPIDFSKILQSNPASVYFVRIAPVNTQGQYLAPPSNTVKVVVK